MHCVHHATACVQRTYVVCCSKGNQWWWGMYLLRDEIKRLVVEWTGTLVEFRHTYNEFDCFHSYSGRFELQLSLYYAVQFRHILQTILATRRTGHYIWVSETSTQQLDNSLPILQVSLLPLFLFLRNIIFKDMEKQLPWKNNKSTIERFEGRSSSLFFVLSTSFFNTAQLMLSVDGRMRQCHPVICAWTADYFENIHLHSVKQPHCPVCEAPKFLFGEWNSSLWQLRDNRQYCQKMILVT